MTYFRYVESGIAYMACGAAFVSGGVGASLLNMLYDLSSNATALETAALLGMFWLAFGVFAVAMIEDDATRNP